MKLLVLIEREPRIEDRDSSAGDTKSQAPELLTAVKSTCNKYS